MVRSYHSSRSRHHSERCQQHHHQQQRSWRRERSSYHSFDGQPGTPIRRSRDAEDARFERMQHDYFRRKEERNRRVKCGHDHCRRYYGDRCWFKRGNTPRLSYRGDEVNFGPRNRFGAFCLWGAGKYVDKGKIDPRLRQLPGVAYMMAAMRKVLTDNAAGSAGSAGSAGRRRSSLPSSSSSSSSFSSSKYVNPLMMDRVGSHEGDDHETKRTRYTIVPPPPLSYPSSSREGKDSYDSKRIDHHSHSSSRSSHSSKGHADYPLDLFSAAARLGAADLIEVDDIIVKGKSDRPKAIGKVLEIRGDELAVSFMKNDYPSLEGDVWVDWTDVSLLKKAPPAAADAAAAAGANGCKPRIGNGWRMWEKEWIIYDLTVGELTLPFHPSGS